MLLWTGNTVQGARIFSGCVQYSHFVSAMTNRRIVKRNKVSIAAKSPACKWLLVFCLFLFFANKRGFSLVKREIIQLYQDWRLICMQICLRLLFFCSIPGLWHSAPNQNLQFSWHNLRRQGYFWPQGHDEHTACGNKTSRDVTKGALNEVGVCNTMLPQLYANVD